MTCIYVTNLLNSTDASAVQWQQQREIDVFHKSGSTERETNDKQETLKTVELNPRELKTNTYNM